MRELEEKLLGLQTQIDIMEKNVQGSREVCARKRSPFVLGDSKDIYIYIVENDSVANFHLIFFFSGNFIQW